MKWLKYTIVGIVIALVAACVALVIHALNESARFTGPDHIKVTGDRQIWLTSRGFLHRFTADGVRSAKYALAQLGLSDAVSDFYPLPNDELLVAELDSPDILRCSLPKGPCVKLSGKAPGWGMATSTKLRLTVNEQEHRLFVADPSNHRLLMLDMDGTLLDTVLLPRRTFIPMEITLLADNTLLFADASTGRIRELRTEENRFSAKGVNFHSMIRYSHTQDSHLLAAIQLPNGDRWVIDSPQGYKDGNVYSFSPSGTPLRQIMVGSQISSLAQAGEEILAASAQEFRVRHVGLDGKKLKDFGSADFISELDAYRDRQAHWNLVQTSAQVGVIAFPILGILALLGLGEPMQRPGHEPLRFDRPAAVADEVVWIAPSALTLALRKQNQLTSEILKWGVVPFTIFLAIQQARNGPPEFLILYAAFGTLLTGLILWLIFIDARSAREQLGTQGEELLYDPGNGIVQHYPLHELKTDGRLILAGKRLIQLTVYKGPRYDREAIEQQILTRLPKAAQLSPTRLYIASLMAGNPMNWFLIAFVSLFAILQLIETLSS